MLKLRLKLLTFICSILCILLNESLTSLVFASDLKNHLKRPKLVVTMVIDQFRADYLRRFESRFLPATRLKGDLGGFLYLMSQGAYYPQGQYKLMQNITAPGHATILSGAYPYQSGIPLNFWYDKTRAKSVYCVETPDGSRGPLNYIPSTIGDELKNAGYPSRVISISLKDRAAILLGGHRADLALWLDKKTHQWTTSPYYLRGSELPQWVKQLNENGFPPKGKSIVWQVSESDTGFTDPLFSSFLDHENTRGLGGKTFPHIVKFGEPQSTGLPIGLELTETAAERAIEALHLGQGKATDLLAVSFSSHDIVGHAFSPNSREMEELTVAEDRVLSKFFNFLKKKIPGGLQDVVLVFTADHGAPPNPEWAQSNHLNAGRVKDAEITQQISEHLNKKFGKPKEKWIADTSSLNFYINNNEVTAKHLNPEEVQNEIKYALLNDSRFAYSFTLEDYRNRKLPPGVIENQIIHSYYPGRSGDVVGIPKAFIMPGWETSNHSTGYQYDSTVPIIIVGRMIKPGVYAQSAEVVDIAPTLSFLLGTIPPSNSEGRVLSEVLK